MKFDRLHKLMEVFEPASKDDVTDRRVEYYLVQAKDDNIPEEIIRKMIEVGDPKHIKEIFETIKLLNKLDKDITSLPLDDYNAMDEIQSDIWDEMNKKSNYFYRDVTPEVDKLYYDKDFQFETYRNAGTSFFSFNTSLTHFDISFLFRFIIKLKSVSLKSTKASNKSCLSLTIFSPKLRYLSSASFLLITNLKENLVL